MFKPILYATLFLALIYQNSSAQVKKITDILLNKSTFNKIRFEDPARCDSIEKWAKSDIDNQTVFLFIQSGIAPVLYKADSIFENKYGVYFADFGDVSIADESCIVKYDFLIFNYLTAKYSNRWTKEIRKDVIGFKDWKKKRRKPL